MNLYCFLNFFSATSFLFFGLSCFILPNIKLEFKRYGIANSRKLVGILQLLGAIGLILGYFYSQWLQASAALGLFILMFLGFYVRVKIKDSFIQSIPSLSYALLNGYIFLFSIS